MNNCKLQCIKMDVTEAVAYVFTWPEFRGEVWTPKQQNIYSQMKTVKRNSLFCLVITFLRDTSVLS
jgi:hypothetical protein